MNRKWYKEMSVYHIWTRSFCDSNGDGIGDLGGVMSKLDYIKSLGVDGIWFSPIYPTPNADYGYDVADYRDINPEFGTLDDFKKLLDEAHKRDMKVFMDLVVNHTSDEHWWFKESCKGPDNPYHDYYIWREGKGDKPPNNWKSIFEGGAWEYVPEINKYYLHLFAKKQPDLNMDNPKVREEVKDIMRFWLDMGVDGFREDVITFISKAEGLPDGIPIPVACGIEHYLHGPHLGEYLDEFREVLNEYDCFAVGEGPMLSLKDAVEFCSEGPNKKLDMMISFDHMKADGLLVEWIPRPFSLKSLKSNMSKWQEAMYDKGWNCLYLENHDHPRVISRYGSEKFRVESGKMLAAMYILQCGTPFIYQGQEIGMTNIIIDNIDDFKDVSTFNNYRLFKNLLKFSDERFLKLANRASRENARTPVHWSAEKNAGFTTGEPWFKINENYESINVEQAEKDPNSILHFYRKLINFRKGNDLVIYGRYKEYDKNNRRAYIYERTYKNERLLVMCSFASRPMTIKAPAGYNLEKGELIITNYDGATIKDNAFKAKPYEVRVYHFK